MNQLMISISGVRGIIGESLTPEVVTRFAAAFGSMTGGGRIVLGRDGRISGASIHHAALAGLLATGCDVRDLGVCPTPAVQIHAEKAAGGMVLTASHNPVEWNGLKFIGPDGLFLGSDRASDLSDRFRQHDIHYVSWDRLGTVTVEDNPLKRPIDRVLGLTSIDAARIRQRAVTVVFDGCNASMSEAGPRFLERLGCRVIPLHCEPTGIFSREPEPVPAHLGDLCAAVIEHGADAGFAVDPDGDRLSIVSEEGKALGEEYTLALAVQCVLSRKKGPVVINLSTSRMIEDIAAAAGVRIHRTPVGEINVAEALRDRNGVVGGEGNGGVILPEAHYGRDAMVGMALVLQALVHGETSISHLAGALPSYHMIKRKYRPDVPSLDPVMAAVAEHFAALSPDCTDGVRLSQPDRWVHIRKSNTEPIIRVIAEAPTENETELLVQGTIKTIESLIQRSERQP